MSKYFQIQWREFVRDLTANNKLTPNELLFEILNFLKKNLEFFKKKPFSDYDFEQFLDVDINDYLPEINSYESANVQYFINTAKRYENAQEATIALFLRDALEDMLIFESGRTCPRCGRSGMGVLKNRLDDRLAFLCRQCGLGVYFDESKVKPGELKIASITDLHNAHLI